MAILARGQGNWVNRARSKLSRRIYVAIAFIALALILIPVLVVFLKPDKRYDLLHYVNPLLGTLGPGHVFPGATLPYGMVKAVADSTMRGSNAAGFVSDDSKIYGFSHLHDSGTGGDPSLGNFPIFAHPGCPEDDPLKCPVDAIDRELRRKQGSVEARPGYFAIGLDNNVFTEMTTTAHTALYRFNFPGNAKVDADGVEVPNSPFILIDLTDLKGSRSGGNIEVDPSTGRMTGNGTFQPSFGQGLYSAHFCADFRGAKIRKTGTFLDDVVNDTANAMGELVDDFFIPDDSAGTWVHFSRPSSDKILARVGISFISVEQACASAEDEIKNFNFEATVKASEDAWREHLSVITVDSEDINPGILTTFWSGIYRTMLSPQNYTGENQAWDSTEPYYDSFYCIWDSFRAQHPLLTILDPDTHSEMIRSLIDTYKHEGFLPDCRMSFSKGYTQGGSNADVVLADALIKNLTNVIDWELGYKAVLADAENKSADWAVEGRGNLDDWHKLGYIPYDASNSGSGVSWVTSGRSVSRSVEYAYNDFVIGVMARSLGKTNDADKYFERGRNWRNLVNTNVSDPANSSFQGFMQPRAANGSWTYQNPRLCTPDVEPDACYLGTEHATYEGSSWLYTLYVPQDMAGLISSIGDGTREDFANRLEHLHESGLVDMGNELGFLPTYQFHYAGRPGRSAAWVHNYIPRLFNASSPGGIPGNDDCAMGAFAALSMMGVFPVAGQDVYLITPPFFKEINLDVLDDNRGRKKGGQEDARRATIRISKGFDPGNGYKNMYIQSATMDGEPYTKSWFDHDFFVRGGTLDLVVGSEESDWGTREEDLPPSFSTGMP